MPYSRQSQTSARRGRGWILAAVVATGMAAAGFALFQPLAVSLAAPARSQAPASDPSSASAEAAPIEVPGVKEPAAPPSGGAAAGAAAFDDGSPAVANLNPALLAALREAAAAAAADGVEFQVTSGWRSAEHQEQLLAEAIIEYGSEEEARRWVATPETSSHVSGDAVDIGNAPGVDWLSRYGSAYGLCQIYGNERWHYELRPDAATHGCPAMYADPTHDPRMQ
jgi:zinc D-Ala-D-Ala carboxypeptidase